MAMIEANKENVQLHQLSDLISADPAFASEVLTILGPSFPSTMLRGKWTAPGQCLN